MRALSPALRTGLALLGPDTRIADRGDYLRVETPSQPSFFFGTLLVFRRPPRRGDDERWRALLRAEFADTPAMRHETFAWEGGDPAPEALAGFVAAGFEYQRDELLACAAVAPPARPAGHVTVRALDGDTDWRAVSALETFEPPWGVSHAAYREFVVCRMAARRALVEAGMGHWFGAFLPDGRLVANLGLFVVDGLARFQGVGTHAEHRRRGIASTLVHAAASRIASERAPERFLIVADPDGPAIGLYRALGFQRAGGNWGLVRPPAADAAPTGA